MVSTLRGRQGRALTERDVSPEASILHRLEPTWSCYGKHTFGLAIVPTCSALSLFDHLTHDNLLMRGL